MSVHVINDPGKREAHLVCHAPSAKTKLRGFLREHGCRPRGTRTRWTGWTRKAIVREEQRPDGSIRRYIRAPRRGGSGFVEIYAPRMRTSLAVYRLTGDDWLRIRTLELPTTDWGRLAQLSVGQISVGQALP